MHTDFGAGETIQAGCSRRNSPLNIDDSRKGSTIAGTEQRYTLNVPLKCNQTSPVLNPTRHKVAYAEKRELVKFLLKVTVERK